MSKSLKNFKKISDFISIYNPNTFRLYFCNSKWDMDMDFTENGLSMANANDKKITEFFQNIKVWIRENNLNKDLKFNYTDSILNNFFNIAKNNIHLAFCDNFNTPEVISIILELIKKVYEYEDKCRLEKNLKIFLIYSIGKFISDILKCLGLVYKTEFVDYFKISENNTNSNYEEVITPFINVMSDFRDKVKDICIKENEPKKVLAICDKFKDEILPNLGIKIEDKGKNEKSIWKFYDKEVYLREKQKENELKENKKKQKEFEAKQYELKLSMTAKEYFASQVDKYSEFDENGVPIKNAKGEILSKEQYNRLKKDFAKHEKQHQKWLEKKNLENLQ